MTVGTPVRCEGREGVVRSTGFMWQWNDNYRWVEDKSRPVVEVDFDGELVLLHLHEVEVSAGVA